MSSTELGKGCKETKTEKQTQRDLSTQRQSDKETERGGRQREREEMGFGTERVGESGRKARHHVSQENTRKGQELRAVLPLFTETTSAPGSVLSPREKKEAQA